MRLALAAGHDMAQWAGQRLGVQGLHDLHLFSSPSLGASIGALQAYACGMQAKESQAMT